MFLSLTDEWHPSRIGWVSLSADHCPKILFLAFYGVFFPRSLANLASTSCQCLPRTEDPFPNFLWQKGTIFLVLKARPIIWLFFLSISSGHATTTTYIPFSIHPTKSHGMLAAFDLHSDCFSSQSWDLLVQTQRVGESILLFLSWWHTTSH